MATFADREGNFRAEIIEYGIQESQQTGSQSVAVSMKVKLLEYYGEGEWHPWSDYDQEAYGAIWVIKKDGTLNDAACQSLMKNAGWDGDFSSLDNKTWNPKRCQVKLEANEYNGKTTYKVGFVNGYDDVPGGNGLSSVGPEKAKALSARFGSSLRAIKGTLAQSAVKAPAGKPSDPIRRPTQAPVGAGVANGQQSYIPPNDEIPF